MWKINLLSRSIFSKRTFNNFGGNNIVRYLNNSIHHDHKNIIIKQRNGQYFKTRYLLHNNKYNKSFITSKSLDNIKFHSFHSSAQAAVVPILPTILFTIPLSIPYLLLLRFATTKYLLPSTRNKISKLFASALILTPIPFLSTFDIAPNTNRHRFMILWPWEEQKLVQKAQENVEMVIGSETLIPSDDPRTQMFKQVCHRLWQHGISEDDRNNGIKEPTVYLIDNEEFLDGVSYPCSAITLTSCWLKLIDYDESLLAAVVAHEIAHILQNHASEFYGMSFIIKVLTQLGEMIGNIIPGLNKEGFQGRPILFLQQHSQKLEKEADLLGQEIMARAGYDPAKAIELWELMVSLEEINKNSLEQVQIPKSSHDEEGRGIRHVSDTFRYHPLKEHRVKYLTENLLQAQNLYDKTIE
ncbi:27944_t:CDS:2 [Dentiscutata erythropus]|uniref:27944_t:CDS:1 n=1 Tax=Dentiscutata erythropus TaxID=1348616 RepID=A0A9N8Z5T1_9GLOM|nr:27944_t:CDS:2 [Dentiscutata erythropus]